MDKYGVCSNCNGRPKSATDLTGFIKTASGDVECGQCGQLALTALIFDDTVEAHDEDKKDTKDNEEKSDI